jgi:hypothetical protein
VSSERHLSDRVGNNRQVLNSKVRGVVMATSRPLFGCFCVSKSAMYRVWRTFYRIWSGRQRTLVRGNLDVMRQFDVIANA